MSVFFYFGVLIFLFIAIVPIKLKTKINYNFLKNKGILKFYFFKINFLSLKIKVKKKYIYLTTKKGKVILVPLDNGNEKNIQQLDLTYVLFDKTTINTVKIYINAGIKDNPFYTALIYGGLSLVNNAFLSLLKTKKLSVILENKIIPTYSKDIGTIFLTSSIQFSIFDYIWGILFYIFKLKRVGKRYERRK